MIPLTYKNKLFGKGMLVVGIGYDSQNTIINALSLKNGKE